MSSNKRVTKRKKKQEATLVGDLFKILFAVSMLIVAILIAFFVFKNVDGFSLPDLRVTLSETESNEPITVTVADTKSETVTETTSVRVKVTETQAVETTADEVEELIESVEASIEEIESKNKEEIKEDGPEKPGTEKEEDNPEKSGSEKKEDISESEKKPDSSKPSKKEEKTETIEDRDYEESDYTDEAEKPRVMPENTGNGVIGDGPVAGDNNINESPIAVIGDNVEISNNGPTA
ncbi:hypothetical protein SAMN05216349_11386 [Oribacterium sp. KHPX15]|uniref:hypothetical protein n=1 Tax=Oribacterium sp. KHPX15 TaxID=1855342 RepID=UPI0008945059|nr:hypothetical protein [Oribacterium sp. KHPX15]SEA47232.1 hypothetical protein SAMN05216349_11386 [Oribacterium sp. KHPX15]